MPLRRLDSATLADRAYEAIREAIINGTLASDERITERGLAEMLAVSPTPVREAIRRLEEVGLVERTGPRTLRVVDFQERGIREARMAEGALRIVAAKLAARNATVDQLATMERWLDAGDIELARLETMYPDGVGLTEAELAPLLSITRHFHAAMNAGCNNPLILRLLTMVDAFDLAARPRELTAELSRDGSQSAIEHYHQHRAIYDAVRARDAAAAERLMTEHIREPSDWPSSQPVAF